MSIREMKYVEVKSSSSPSPGQKHRSSINFTTEGFGKNEVMMIETRDNNNKYVNNITFDIQVDKSGVDDTLHSEAYGGMKMSNTKHRNLYIADPKNAAGDFIVSVSSFEQYEIEKHTVPLGTGNDQFNYYCSINIGKVETHCVRFAVYYNYGASNQQIADDLQLAICHGVADSKLMFRYRNISHGTIIQTNMLEAIPNLHLVITNPSGDKAVTVIMETAKE